MTQLPPRNSVAVESPYGLRTFALRLGDVTSTPDSVIAVPTHANLEFPPDGVVLRTMFERYGTNFDHVEPVVSAPDSIGTFRVLNKGSYPGKEVLMVRIPAARRAERTGTDPVVFLNEALWTLFGSLAALELRTPNLNSLALPLLAGTRGYSVSELLKVILQHSLAWLRTARYMTAVNFYIFDESAMTEWNAVMDEVLGRHFVDTANNEFVKALRSEMLMLFASGRLRASSDEWQQVLISLQECLEQPRIPLERLALDARKFAELVAASLLLEQTSQLPDEPLNSRIRTLRINKVTAPWIIGHLDSLRHFGNAAAHPRSVVSYEPPKLQEEDMVGLLAALRRLLDFWINRRNGDG